MSDIFLPVVAQHATASVPATHAMRIVNMQALCDFAACLPAGLAKHDLQFLLVLLLRGHKTQQIKTTSLDLAIGRPVA
jgi:hypothetical protein